MEYHLYLRSEAWRLLRREVISRASGVCERCRQWPVVNVHHLTYERLGRERLEDLLGVCAKCHEEIHLGDSAVTDKQLDFDALFEGQTFGPDNGFERRDFQVAGLMDFAAFSKLPRTTESGRRVAWIFNGGTGAGKTKLAGLIASHVLNTDDARQVILVVPNRTILRKSKADFLKYFGIDLVIFNKRKHQDGIPRRQQGYLLTYSKLLQDPGLHRDISQTTKTLVIFDEIHHLGDHPDSTWGAKAIEAFGSAAHLVGLTGTPYRSDNHPIPFVEYLSTAEDGLLRFKANMTYSLGQAVAQGYCRKPKFVFHYGKVKIRDASGKETIVDFKEDVLDEIGSLRLRGAVAYGSSIRKDLLKNALEQCRLEKRKVIIFLGGDTCGETTPTVDATDYLPSELVELGYGSNDFEVVTGDDPTAQKRIDDFQGHPTKWILVSINMVSEGTDIPSLSAAIFLTSITAKQTTIQRIGRILRMMENDPHETGLIFMFCDSNLEELAREIENEVNHEINLKKRRDSKRNEGEGSPRPPRKAEAIGIGDAPLEKVITTLKSGKVVEFPAKEIERAQCALRGMGISASYDNAVAFLLGKVGSA